MKRRKFLGNSLMLMGGIPLASINGLKWDKTNAIRFGVISDVHYANKEPQGHRYYKESLQKMAEYIEEMNKEKVDFLIELGDFKDKGHSVEETLHFLDTIEKEFQQFNGPCYHVLGNHDEDNISKDQFLTHIKNGEQAKAKNYYSFEKASFQFIILDANFTSKGEPYNQGNFDWKDCHIPSEQLSWLEQTVKNSALPVVVFIHQRLDSFYSLKNYCPDNADNVRKALEDSGKVLAVFQGHDHRGGFNSINNIPYYTIPGVIEGEGKVNNSYALVEIKRSIHGRFIMNIKGYRKAPSMVVD